MYQELKTSSHMYGLDTRAALYSLASSPTHGCPTPKMSVSGACEADKCGKNEVHLLIKQKGPQYSNSICGLLGKEEIGAGNVPVLPLFVARPKVLWNMTDGCKHEHSTCRPDKLLSTSEKDLTRELHWYCVLRWEMKVIGLCEVVFSIAWFAGTSGGDCIASHAAVSKECIGKRTMRK